MNMKKIYDRLLIVFVMLLGMYGIGLFIVPEGSLTDRTLATIAYPMVRVKSAMLHAYESVKRMIQIHHSSDQLCAEYQRRYEDLQAQYIALVGSVTMCQDIEELLMFKKRYHTNHALIVDVISKQFSPSEHFFLIEGGKNKGIIPDMVAVYKNCLIGRVNEVYDRYSKIMLITDPQCKVSALCRKSLDRGIHEGTGALDVTQLSYVFDTQMDLEKRLIKGDFVISSGEGLVFPKGFGLGTIVDYKKNDLHVDITIKPLLDLKKLDYCCILAKGSELQEADFAGNEVSNTGVSGIDSSAQPTPADMLIKKLEQPVAKSTPLVPSITLGKTVEHASEIAHVISSAQASVIATEQPTVTVKTQPVTHVLSDDTERAIQTNTEAAPEAKAAVTAEVVS